MATYSKKDQIEEIACSIRRAYHFANKQQNYAYPKELERLIEPLEKLMADIGEIELKYFEKQWKAEDEKDFNS